ncbi:MAG TPA: hypothetical protein VFC23_09370 [Thermoanaerobaculia bacterium]|nr:hypothetical protein [Thermoanaerobaculia bacterium]
MAVNAELLQTLRRGIDCCRRGDWNEGLRHLGQIAERGETGLPGIFYSYLGYGIALREQRVREGLQLCRHSIKVEFYQADNYLNLARTCLLARHRSGAVRAVRDGLKIDPHHPGLLALRQELGVRGRPLLPFLDRGHFLNQFLGRIRHALRGEG